MNLISPFLINRLWLASQRNEAKLFAKNVPIFEQEQQRILRRYMANNAATEYGQVHDFANISDYRSFAKKVPIAQHWEKDIFPYVNKIAEGEPNILTRAAVLALEETSGTSGFAKLIPYTETLKKEFQRAVAVWMHALWRQAPAAFRGRSYWSLSPALKPPSVTAGGIRIGLEDDSEYLDFLAAWALKRTLAVPASVKRETDARAFYFKSLLHLLAADDLSFISVWSPSFFLQLDDFLQNYFADILARDQGQLSRRRKETLQSISKGSWVWKDIWPSLASISCWTDAQSALWIPQLKERIGEVAISRKGLFSTECVVSVPFAGATSSVLSYRSHFYEFRELASRNIVLAHQLQRGQCYEVIVTTGGGLYRYATSDIVEITDFCDQLPQIRFAGRDSRQSDLVGEKLSEFQVQQAIDQLEPALVARCRLLFVYPFQKNKIQGGYKIYFLPNNPSKTMHLAQELQKIENSLSGNPYYRQAIRSGQLVSLTVECLPEGADQKILNHYKKKKNLRDGDLKLPLLFEFGFLDDLNL